MKNKINKNKINKLNKIKSFFEKGNIRDIDKITPSYINMKNPKYIEIDNIIYGGLIITNYIREQEDIILKNIIENNLNMNISIFYEKQKNNKL